MRMMLVVIVALVIGVGPRWQKYKVEKIAAYQAQHGGDQKHHLIDSICGPQPKSSNS